MSDPILSALADARNALLVILPDRVFWPYNPIPDDENPLIRIDPLGHADRVKCGSVQMVMRVQVTVWASNLDTALPIAQQAREVMLAQRFIPEGGRAIFDPETKSAGWAADYRRQ